MRRRGGPRLPAAADDGRPRPIERAQSVRDAGPETARMKPQRKVGPRVSKTPPKPLRRRAAARVIIESPSAGPAPAVSFEPRAPIGTEPDRVASDDGIEAVSEAEIRRESEQAVGVDGRAEPEAGAPSDSQSPPYLEER